MNRGICTILLLLSPLLLLAQAITHTYPLPAKYFTLTYENDVFNQTDKYYTQGIRAEVSHPLMKKLPLYKPVDEPRNQVGFAIEHDVYTPVTITYPGLLPYGTRPYAACLLANVFMATHDSARRQTITLGVSIGVIGPAAGGAEMQTAIHRAIGSDRPKGWQYQIANDLALNYELSWHRQTVHTRFFGISLSATGRAGTLNTRATAYMSFTAGLLPQPSRPFSLYTYASPTINAIGYDATLQGGIFNRTSPYIVYAGDISRITYGYRAGIICNLRHIQLEYATTYLSKEYATGESHRWGRGAVSWLW